MAKKKLPTSKSLDTPESTQSNELVQCHKELKTKTELDVNMFQNQEQVNNILVSNPSILSENQFSREELLQQIVYYAEQLLINIEGIFIGGHAAQTRDQLFEVLSKYKNSI